MTTSSEMPTRAYSYIRMSTDLQLKGDSRRRQLEMSERYAAKHGLELIKEFQLEDLGVSAFRGANLSAGSSLGRFLQSVQNGEVPSGSYLLLESLDRLSRQDVLTSLSVFTDLIKAGVKIVTLADEQVYSVGKTDFGQLVVSLAIMSRAHEESQMKSRRLGEAWENKRRTATEKKLTAISPAWLDLAPDRRSFIVNKERARIVASIFRDAAAGLGSFSIARRLNESSVAPLGRSNGWQMSYVSKILTNRATIGEYQPHQMVDGKRTPVGEAIADYFPPIVDEELFMRVQASRSQRKTGAAGRKGEFVSNLFSGLLRCAYCGSTMHFINSGTSLKGETYLVCDSARRRVGCVHPTGWRYDDFEESFLTFVEEIDLETTLRSEGAAGGRGEYENAAMALVGRRLQLEKERERIFRLLLDQETASDFLKKELAKCEHEIGIVIANHASLVSTRQTLEAEVSTFYESRSEIRNLVEKLRSRAGGDVYRLRTQVAARLKGLIATINVASDGIRHPEPNNLVLLGAGKDEVLVPGDQLLQSRQFNVIFRDGVNRVVIPLKADPADGQTQIYRTLAPKGLDR